MYNISFTSMFSWSASIHSPFLLLKVYPSFGCGFVLPHAAHLFQRKLNPSSAIEVKPHWLKIIPLAKVIGLGTYVPNVSKEWRGALS